MIIIPLSILCSCSNLLVPNQEFWFLHTSTLLCLFPFPSDHFPSVPTVNFFSSPILSYNFLATKSGKETNNKNKIFLFLLFVFQFFDLVFKMDEKMRTDGKVRALDFEIFQKRRRARFFFDESHKKATHAAHDDGQQLNRPRLYYE